MATDDVYLNTGARCDECGRRIRYGTDYYVLKNRVWNKAMTGKATGKDKEEGYFTCDGVPGHLHVVCVEKRLGRELTQRDFTDAPINHGVFGFNIIHFEK